MTLTGGQIHARRCDSTPGVWCHSRLVSLFPGTVSVAVSRLLKGVCHGGIRFRWEGGNARTLVGNLGWGGNIEPALKLLGNVECRNQMLTQCCFNVVTPYTQSCG